ncbi:hypothetical protein [Vibrio coralliilyticus]|uniref:VgrG-related protein n=1 Tax=Vibrio coralliilyticus TaxID=190893 RepID=UPI00030F64F9|nr:hypothetical protein [Vibrio coralliilyticus]AXN33948.1 vgrG protein [Vibrio coralliilyticus]KPH24513.1 vgrG protein [Vibrio coralliilyticus]
MDAVFPITQRNGEPYHTLSDFTKLFDQVKSGRYLLGQGYGWHSGVHLTSKMVPWGKGLRPIQAMMDGKIVAYRIHADYQTTTYKDQELKYSNNFVLLEHEYKNPEKDDEVFKLYSLYMHLAPPSDIGANSSLTTRYKLLTSRNIRKSKSDGSPSSTGFLANTGTILEYLYAEEKETVDYEISNQSYHMIQCRVIHLGGSPSTSLKKSWEGKIVWFASGKDSKFSILNDSSIMIPEPISEPKWMSNVASQRDGSIVTLEPPLPLNIDFDSIEVKAGDELGYMGLHEYSNDANATKKEDNRVHIELFSVDEPLGFIQKALHPQSWEGALIKIDGSESDGTLRIENPFYKSLLQELYKPDYLDFSSFTPRDAKIYLENKRDKFSKVIAKHPSDWCKDSSFSMYNSIHDFAKSMIDDKYKTGFVSEEQYLLSPWRQKVMSQHDIFSQHEKERAELFSWLHKVKGFLKMEENSVWHFWPFSIYNKFAKLGHTSEIYESGGRGPGTISTGRGDRGGKSYGVYQLASNIGVLDDYLKESSFKDNFAGLTTASREFDEKWKEIAREHEDEFRSDQHSFIKKTHYDVQYKKLVSEGIIKDTNSAAINDLIWSTSVQYGPNTNLIINSVNDKKNLDYIKIISKVQDYKHDKVDKLFRSSPTLWPGLKLRAKREKSKLLKLLDQRAVIKE